MTEQIILPIKIPLIRYTLLQFRWHFRVSINRSPGIYLPLVKMKGNPNEKPVTKETDVCIEGFPRSANSFSVAAFQFAQNRHLNIAHHVHAPAQIKRASKLNIPTMVLVRNPEQCILSLRAYAPYISTRQALKEYIRFYTSILPYKQNYVVAMFSAVLENYGNIIRLLNRKFMTDFTTFNHTEANVKYCFKMIEKLGGNGGTLSEAFVSRPSQYRNAKKKLLKASFWDKDLDLLRSKANRLYNIYRGFALLN